MMAWDIAYAELKRRLDSELGLVAELSETVEELTSRVENLEAKLEEIRSIVDQNSTSDIEYWISEVRMKLDM